MIKQDVWNVRLATVLTGGELLVILYVATQHHQRYASSPSLSSACAILGAIPREVKNTSQHQGCVYNERAATYVISTYLCIFLTKTPYFLSVL
jgi:hypothetical protein